MTRAKLRRYVNTFVAVAKWKSSTGKRRSFRQEFGNPREHRAMSGVAIAILLLMPRITQAAVSATNHAQVTPGEEACARLAGAYLDRTESISKEQMEKWNMACSHASAKNACDALVMFVEVNRHIHVFDCDGGLPKIDSKVALADDACASFVGTVLAHAEADDPDQVSQWKNVCEHHPVQSTCESTARFIRRSIGRPIIDCAGERH